MTHSSEHTPSRRKMKVSPCLNKSFGIPSSPEKSLEAPKHINRASLYQQMVRMKVSSYQINVKEQNCEDTCYCQCPVMLLGHCGRACPSSLL